MRLLSQYNMVFANKTAHMNNMLLDISCYVPLLSLPVDVTPTDCRSGSGGGGLVGLCLTCCYCVVANVPVV